MSEKYFSSSGIRTVESVAKSLQSLLYPASPFCKEGKRGFLNKIRKFPVHWKMQDTNNRYWWQQWSQVTQNIVIGSSPRQSHLRQNIVANSVLGELTADLELQLLKDTLREHCHENRTVWGSLSLKLCFAVYMKTDHLLYFSFRHDSVTFAMRL